MWPLYERVLKGDLICTSLSDIILKAYSDFAIEEILEMAKSVSEYKAEHFWCLPYWVEKNMQNVLNILHTAIEQGTMDLGASAQLAINQMGDAILHAGKEYFSANTMWNVMDGEKLLASLRTAYRFICDSKLKESCAAFGKEVKSQIKYLAPQEVEDQARLIKMSIQEFCDKPDKVQYSLRLIKDCSIPLREILNALGGDNLYYRRISTRVADNAIYSADVDFSAAIRMYNNPQNDQDLAMAHLMSILKQCRLLAANIGLFNLEDDFLSGKFRSFKQFIEGTANKYGIDEEEVTPNISMSSDYDLFLACGDDYQKLKEFVASQPESQYLGQAVQKIWYIEDNAYPKQGNPNSEYRKALFEYKIKFPTSHNEEKLLNEIIALLFGNLFCSIFEYRQFIRLWPNHPKKQIALERIDKLSFLACTTIDEFNRYLNEYPQGKYQKEAKAKITELQNIEIKKFFDQCETIADYNRFILKYPTSDLVDTARAKIEDIVYANAKRDNDYNTYLKLYPNGRYAEIARRQKEHEFYQRVIKEKAYRDYYNLYPNGEYTLQVRAAEEDDCFKRCKHTEDFKKYLNAYPYGRYKDIAVAVIKRDKRRDLYVKLAFVIAGLFIICLIALQIDKFYLGGTDNYDPQSTATDINVDIDSLGGPKNAAVKDFWYYLKMEDAPVPEYDKFYEYLSSGDKGGYEHRKKLYDGLKDDGYPLPNTYAKFMLALVSGDAEQLFVDNQLLTDDTPYQSHYGRSITGCHEFTFKTAPGVDYIVLIKRHHDDKHIGHKYVRGGDVATMTVPDGTYDVFFYSGNGWNPYKQVGECRGGFVSDESVQKDGPIKMQTRYEGDYYYSQTCDYTLYPVTYGNLQLESSTIGEAFN